MLQKLLAAHSSCSDLTSLKDVQFINHWRTSTFWRWRVSLPYCPSLVFLRHWITEVHTPIVWICLFKEQRVSVSSLYLFCHRKWPCSAPLWCFHEALSLVAGIQHPRRQRHCERRKKRHRCWHHLLGLSPKEGQLSKNQPCSVTNISTHVNLQNSGGPEAKWGPWAGQRV